VVPIIGIYMDWEETGDAKIAPIRAIFASKSGHPEKSIWPQGNISLFLNDFYRLTRYGTMVALLKETISFQEVSP
jgi:hypothetical protein